MSQPFPPPATPPTNPSVTPQEAKKKWYQRPWLVFTIGVAVGITFVITSRGPSPDYSDFPDASNTPASTVTVTAEPQVDSMVQEVTPQACLDALNYAEEVVGYAADTIELAMSDEVTVDSLTKVQQLSEDVDRAVDAYRDAATSCRAAAQ